MWSPNATCRIFSDLTFPPKASSPRLVFEQPRTDKTTLSTEAQAQAQAQHGHPGLFSEPMHSDATSRRPLMLDLW